MKCSQTTKAVFYTRSSWLVQLFSFLVLRVVTEGRKVAERGQVRTEKTWKDHAVVVVVATWKQFLIIIVSLLSPKVESPERGSEFALRSKGPGSSNNTR